MPNPCTPESPRASSPRTVLRPCLTGLLVGASLAGGCAALTNPVAEGIPVRRLPPELLGTARADQKTIPLSLLHQEKPEVYKVGPGDVLGIYINGFLGKPDAPFPVNFTASE